MEGVLQGGIGALVALLAPGASAFFALRARYLVPAGVGAQPVVDPLPAARALPAAGRRRHGGRLPRRAGRGVEPVSTAYAILTPVLRRRYTGFITRQFISRTCMPRFVPDSRPISAQHPLTEFYREEFLKHHRCLQQQRPYYSESAITDVEAALTRIMGTARTTLHARQRPTTGQLTPQEVRRRDRPLVLVRPQADTLTRSLTDLRHDLLAIVRAGIAAAAPDALVDARSTRARRADAGDLGRTHGGRAARTASASSPRERPRPRWPRPRRGSSARASAPGSSSRRRRRPCRPASS